MLGKKILMDDHTAKMDELKSSHGVELAAQVDALEALQSELETVKADLTGVTEAKTALETTNEALVAEVAELKNRPPGVAGADANADDHSDADAAQEELINNSSWNKMADDLSNQGIV